MKRSAPGSPRSSSIVGSGSVFRRVVRGATAVPVHALRISAASAATRGSKSERYGRSAEAVTAVPVSRIRSRIATRGSRDVSRRWAVIAPSALSSAAVAGSFASVSLSAAAAAMTTW